ncbi:MAG: hypothetical protein NZ739_02435 [Verrucomicrobiae bacterium]|nr:hypothetical protein [Verrucomicrobiae bacterium]
MKIQMAILIVSVVSTIICVLNVIAGEGGRKLAVGDPAPPVEGKDQDDKTWKLSQLVGK